MNVDAPEIHPCQLLVLDFGGTKLSAALFDHPGGPALAPGLPLRGWAAHRRSASPPDADGPKDLQNMLSLARELLRGAHPDSIGVSFGGPVDHARGLVHRSDHVPGWEETGLAALLGEVFDAPVWVDNDANVAALGEYHFGAGQGYPSLFYITVSTGVGGGWILNGKPWRGAGGMAGEIGHTVVDPNGPSCLCGKHGCVERLASGPYMAQDARAQLETNLASGRTLPEDHGGRLFTMAGGEPQAVTAEMISQAAAQGDRLAVDLLERSAWALGTAIGDAANLVDPACFVLGGGVTKAGELYWSHIRRAAFQAAREQIRFTLLPAALGDDAPLWGAVALALDGLANDRKVPDR